MHPWEGSAWAWAWMVASMIAFWAALILLGVVVGRLLDIDESANADQTDAPDTSTI